MSDLFDDLGDPRWSRRLHQAQDAERAARIYTRACLEEEIWRFAPPVADLIEMEWLDNTEHPRLLLVRISGRDFLMEDPLEFEPGPVDPGRRWDAIDTLVGQLAVDWDEVHSNYLAVDETGWFQLDRPVTHRGESGRSERK
jgi:hypothetical protein